MENKRKAGKLSEIFYDFVKKNIKLVLGYLLIFAAYPLEQVAFPHYYGKIIDLVSDSKNSNFITKIKRYLYIILILAIVTQALFCFIDYLDVYFLPRIQTHFRDCLVSDIIETFKENYTELEIGELISKIIKLPFTIRDLNHQIRNYILPGIMVIILSVCYFFFINKKLGFVSFCTMFVFLSLSFISSKNCLEGSKIRDEYHNKLHEEIGDSFNNLLSIYSSNNTENEIKHLRNHQKIFDNHYINSSKCSLNFKIIYSVMYIALFILINGYALYLTSKSEISIANLVSVLFINTYLIANVQDFAAEIRDLLFNIGILMESQKFLDNLFSENTIHFTKKININTGSIVCRNIYFKYKNRNSYLFNNLNLVIKPREKIALIGNIGSGKSTITKLIMKLHRCNKGNIIIDGQDIANISSGSIRQQIGYVQQAPKLFNRTIYENITYGTPNVSKNSVITLMKKLQIQGIFKNLPNGLDTIAGKNGTNLSGGQRQSVLILRMLIGNKKILILDEPTSALDSYSKKYVIHLLKYATKNVTTIIITHDDSLLKFVNRIITFKDGKIVSDVTKS